ncbi:hypothetical protein [Helicobacter labacensis]|nr:hypothetical protein [Helicobacter labacensis]
MAQAANSSVQAQSTLKGILNQTTRNLQLELERLNLNAQDI